jgi:hypothetical protein
VVIGHFDEVFLVAEKWGFEFSKDMPLSPGPRLGALAGGEGLAIGRSAAKEARIAVSQPPIHLVSSPSNK